MQRGPRKMSEEEADAFDGPSAPLGLPPKIDPEAEHYPFCVVWTPIPLLSWIIPFIGHVGICDSAGRIYDFEGPYHVGVDQMLFGNPVKYWDMSKTYVPSFYASDEPPYGEAAAACRQEIKEYDSAILRMTQHFRKTQSYNFFSNNCHSFVACVLRDHPMTRKSWGMLRVCFGLAFYGRYVNIFRFLKAHLPFFIFMALIIVIVVVTR